VPMPADSLPDDFLTRLAEAQCVLDRGFARLPLAPRPALDERAAAILAEAASRLSQDDPYHHPLYAGQMLKPPHPIARAAYALAMSLNPNNHALDGGRASSAMELEAVAHLAKMFGWGAGEHLGHLTSGGTFANLEALWIGGQLHPGKAIVASDQAHYTHARICGVLGLPFVSIVADETGCMDIAALEAALQRHTLGTVVVTLGTTATGAVDPLPQILELQARYKFRIHADAAYGGYFTLAANLAAAARGAFDAIAAVDSLVIDPHKHGLQPYGCGCVLFRDSSVGRFYKHDSPYTYFTSKDLHLGEISLECSRAGASAVALWATQRLLPCVPGGEFAQGLEASCEAARVLHGLLATDSRFILPIAPPQLDIVVWAVRGNTPEASSTRAQAIFDHARSHDLYLALAKLPTAFFPQGTWPAGEATHVTCLRTVLMKPEHVAWIDEIWLRLKQAANSADVNSN
jgi:tyrosine decarboxylase/aspartate 1-decarboxylase